VAPERHRRISLLVILTLLALGIPPLLHVFGFPWPSVFADLWPGWAIWGALLTLLGFRHPMLLDDWQRLDGKRRTWAAIALLIFLLCFTPAPFTIKL
jgi:hypothetical protein